jgi:heme A synthase
VRTTYRVLAWILALEVVVQAAAIAWALFGLTAWIDGGGVLDAAAIEAEVQFDGVVGFMVHGMNGTMIVPAVALLLLIVSFFAKLPRGVTYAAALFVMVVAQVALGIYAHSLPSLGMLHGALALAILVTAVLSARLTATPRAAVREPAAMV